MNKFALIAAALLVATPAAAQDDEEALVAFSVLKPEVALALAEATLEACRAEGYQIAVTVVDRFGLPQVMLRDRFAGAHTIDTATRKAWTAASFRTATLQLAEMTNTEAKFASLREVTTALMLGGGVPVEAAGTLVGGIGVSGAPDPVLDDDCARAGLAAIEDMLPF